MTLSKKEEAHYRRLAERAEAGEDLVPTGTSQHGADAAAAGQALLREAFGSDQAVEEAIRRGRPNLSRNRAAGHSPAVNTRVTEVQNAQLEQLMTVLEFRTKSDVVRAAIDEYAARHLKGA
jgi:hypothetical protein